MTDEPTVNFVPGEARWEAEIRAPGESGYAVTVRGRPTDLEAAVAQLLKAHGWRLSGFHLDDRPAGILHRSPLLVACLERIQEHSDA